MPSILGQLKMQDDTGANNDKLLPLKSHICELRRVIINIFIVFFIIALLCFFVIDRIFDFFVNPLQKILQIKNIVYTSIGEPIAVEFKLAMYTSLFFSMPIALFNIWRFVKPALRENEVTPIKNAFVLTFVLFVFGVTFAWFIVLPNLISNLQTWKLAQIATFLPKMSENLQFIFTILFIFGISFQIPMIMLLLDKMHLLPIQRQFSIWREYTFAITLFSAIITPPDISSMFLLMIPMLLLYFCTIFVVKLMKKC